MSRYIKFFLATILCIAVLNQRQLLEYLGFRQTKYYENSINNDQDVEGQLTAYEPADIDSAKPIEIEWELLTDIDYKLHYFREPDIEAYAPEFSAAVKALDGKEVIIEGFVIPFEEEGGLLSLSANPYASCFFCGKASPASVISLYLKHGGKRYKIDDFKKFRGILHLNHDDPEEFYYILKDAREK